MVQPKCVRLRGSNSLQGPFGTCGKNDAGLPQPLVLQDFSRALLDGVHLHRGQAGDLEDDVTLLTLRRLT